MLSTLKKAAGAALFLRLDLLPRLATLLPVSPNPGFLSKVNRRELSEGEAGVRVLLSEHKFIMHRVVADTARSR